MLSAISLRRKGLAKAFPVFVILCLIMSAGVVPYPQTVSATGEAWSCGGPAGGHVNSIAVASSNPTIIYAGTISGVYKSTDSGSSWSYAGLGGLDIKVVKINPSDASTVYAGGNYLDGFFKSTNGGSTWTGKAVDGVLALAIDPGNPAILWAGTSTGRIYHSSNSGDSWSEKLHHTHDDTDVPVNSIQVDPASSSTVYAGLGIALGGDKGYEGFANSTDSGTSWTFKHLSPYGPWDYGMNLVTSLDGRLFILAEGSINYSVPTVYTSTNQGDTWAEVNVPHIGAVGDYTYRVLAIHASPANADKLYVATNNPDYQLMIYSISGSTWANTTGVLPPLVTAMAVNPANETIAYAGGREGKLCKSTDQGITWAVANLGIRNTYTYDLAVAPGTTGTVYGALWGESFQLQKTTNAGAAWTQLETGTKGYFSAIGVDPGNGSRIFAGKDWDGVGYLYRSTNNGSSWTEMDVGYYSGRVADILIHPENSNIVMVLRRERASYNGGIRITTDGGTTWTHKYIAGKPTRLAMDPQNSSHVFMGKEMLGFVYRSTDTGQTWSSITPDVQWGSVKDMVVDNSGVLFAAATDYEGNTDGGIWRWTSGSWNKLYRFTGSDVTALAIDRSTSPATLYAGTSNAGVFVSTNGGTSWSSFNAGLSVMGITRLELSDAAPRILYAGTDYGGIWSTDVTGSVTVNNPVGFSATAFSPSQINLSWTKNAAGNNVMVVWSATNTFGTPQNGTSYSVGTTIPGGGTVLYRSSGTSTSHNGLTENTPYYYKAYSYTAANAYSSGSGASATTQTGETIVSRLCGVNRYATAVEISRTGWPDGADMVLLARGDDFPDSLAGVSLATQLDIPILLTSPTSLSSVTRAEIERLGAHLVLVLGGPGAISEEVVNAVLEIDPVDETFRFAGVNRYETAQKIAKRLAEGAPFNAVFLASGLNFPDALAAASYGAMAGYPILLTRPDALPQATKDALNQLTSVKHVILAGGTAVIQPAIEAELNDMGLTVQRVAGSNRYNTSVALARTFLEESAEHVFIATGVNFPDALAGGVLAAKQGTGVLLVRGDQDTLPDSVAVFISERDMKKAVILGGTSAVCDAIAGALLMLLE